MSRPLRPRTSQTPINTDALQAPQRSRKISTACSACKQRKTRCSGGSPCDACTSRNTQCIYDATADQRRKIANQRNVRDLAETQTELEKCYQLLGGIIATIRAGDSRANLELINIIRSNISLSQLAAHVRNEYRSNPAIQQAYGEIDFIINGDEELPSPNQMFGGSHWQMNDMLPDLSQGAEQPLTGYSDEYSKYGTDEEHET